MTGLVTILSGIRYYPVPLSAIPHNVLGTHLTVSICLCATVNRLHEQRYNFFPENLLNVNNPDVKPSR